MADGKVKYDFAADVTAAERAIARLEAKTKKLEKEQKQLHRTSKRGSDEFLTGAGKMVSGLVSVSAAVGVATRAYGLWQERIEKLTQAQEKFNDKLLEGLVGSGLLAQGPRMRHVLQNLLPGVTPEQGQAVLEGITAGAPELTPAQTERATRDFSRLAPLYTTFDEEGQLQGAQDLEKISMLRGRFESLLGDKISADDVTDVTILAHQLAGGRAGQLTTPGAQTLLSMLTDQGLSVDRALATMTEFTQEGIEAGTARGIVGKPAAENVSLRQLFAMDPGQRRELLGQEQDDMFARLEQADIDAYTKSFQQAREGDLAKRELARARRLQPGRFIEQETQFRKERFDRVDAQYENDLDKLIDFRFQQMRENVPLIDYVPGFRFGLETLERLDQSLPFVSEMKGTPQEQLSAIDASLQADEQLRKQDETNRLLQNISDKLTPQQHNRRPVNRGAHVEGATVGF